MSRSRFMESSVQSFTRALSRALASEQTSSKPGFLQSLDPRIRVVAIFMLVIAVVLCRRIMIIGSLLCVAVLLAVASRVSLAVLLKRVWLVIFVFTGLIALPALFITRGETVFSIPALHLAVSAQGLRTAALLVLRVETAVTLTTVLVLSTPWNHILKALRWLRIPSEVVTMVAMTHRYVFLLLETANQMFESRKSRTIAPWTGAERRKMTTRTAGVLLSKSIDLSHDVYLSMVARGFQGEVRVLTDFQMKLHDYVALAAFVLAAGAAVWMGR